MGDCCASIQHTTSHRKRFPSVCVAMCRCRCSGLLYLLRQSAHWYKLVLLAWPRGGVVGVDGVGRGFDERAREGEDVDDAAKEAEGADLGVRMGVRVDAFAEAGDGVMDGGGGLPWSRYDRGLAMADDLKRRKPGQLAPSVLRGGRRGRVPAAGQTTWELTMRVGLNGETTGSAVREALRLLRGVSLAAALARAGICKRAVAPRTRSCRAFHSTLGRSGRCNPPLHEHPTGCPPICRSNYGLGRSPLLSQAVSSLPVMYGARNT